MKRLLFVTSTLFLLLFAGCKSKELTAEQQAKIFENIQKVEKPGFKFILDNEEYSLASSSYREEPFYIKVTESRIDVFLPFMGERRIQPTTVKAFKEQDGAINFVSTDFDYKSVKKKNGKYEIIITPKGITDIDLKGLSFRLYLFPDGGGTLDLDLAGKNSWTFWGYYK